MKTNHQRGFVNNTDMTPVLGYYRMYCDRHTGAWAAMHDVFYDGHRGFARAKRATKAHVRHASRRFYKKELRALANAVIASR